MFIADPRADAAAEALKSAPLTAVAFGALELAVVACLRGQKLAAQFSYVGCPARTLVVWQWCGSSVLVRR